MTTLRLLACPTEGLDAERLAAGLRDLARLQAAVAACQARFLGAFERIGGPRTDGATDAVAWLRDRTGLSGREAAEQVRVARTVGVLPAVSDALDEGLITPAHASTIAKALSRTPQVAERADDLLAAAAGAGADQFARTARSIELAAAADDGWVSERARARRTVSERLDDDGTGTLVCTMPADAHVEIVGVLDAIAEELWAADHPAGSPLVPGARAASLGQRRADALVEMARRARSVTPGAGRRDRARVHVLIDHEVLAGRLAGHGLLDDGTPVPAATARRLACSGGVLPWVVGGASVPLDHGRRRRLASDAQIDALVVRDGGCVFPGCSRPWQWCDAHHLDEWDEQDGPTDLDNLALVCETHHHLVHEGAWSLRRTPEGGWHARSPNGLLEHSRPPRDVLAAARAGPCAA